MKPPAAKVPVEKHPSIVWMIHFIFVCLAIDKQYKIKVAISYIFQMYVFTITLSTLVLNSRDLKGNLWPPKSTSGKNHLTITFPSNVGHKSIGTKLLAPYIHSNSMNIL